MNQIDVHDLKNLLDQDAVKLIDGSWALDGTDMHALYDLEHIPGACFFDIDTISDRDSTLPHMAPSPDAFAKAVGAMGISERDHVVVYDRQGLFSAARVWWTFRLMGHARVQVLRGGLPAWREAGFPLTSDTTPVEPVIYEANMRRDLVIAREDLLRALDDSKTLVLDARPMARFNGTVPEPRAGLRSGHMPGSVSLPFGDLMENGALKPADALQTLFHEKGVDIKTDPITSCGSGVTAAIISLALAEIGRESRLYDGSWAEWGREDANTPVVTS